MMPNSQQIISFLLAFTSAFYVRQLYCALHRHRDLLHPAMQTFVKCKITSIFLIGLGQFYVALTDTASPLVLLKLALVFSIAAAHYFLVALKRYEL